MTKTKMNQMLWAVMAIAITMVTNLNSAHAQSMGGVAGGSVCATVDQFANRLAELCKDARYASCPTCVKLKPCFESVCNKEAAPPQPTVIWSSSQECEANQPPAAGAHMANDKCECVEHYSPLTATTRVTVMSATHKVSVKIVRCVPGDRSEVDIARHEAKINELLAARDRLDAKIVELKGKQDEQANELAAARRDINSALGMALTATVKTEAFIAIADAILNRVTKLEAELEGVKTGSVRMSLGLAGKVWPRGNASTLYGGGLVFNLNPWLGPNVGLYVQGGPSMYSGDGIDRQTTDRATLYGAGAAGGLALRPDPSSNVRAQLGFGVEQTFRHGTPAHYGALYGLNGGIYYTPKDSLLSLGLDGTVGAGGASYFCAPNKACEDTGLQGQVGAVISLTTDQLFHF